jgi:hypothetical protein
MASKKRVAMIGLGFGAEFIRVPKSSRFVDAMRKSSTKLLTNSQSPTDIHPTKRFSKTPRWISYTSTRQFPIMLG